MKVGVDEEERVRKAGNILNDKIKDYQEKFGLDDKQDLIAMVAFDNLVDKLDLEESNHSQDQSLNNQINELSRIVAKAL